MTGEGNRWGEAARSRPRRALLLLAGLALAGCGSLGLPGGGAEPSVTAAAASTRGTAITDVAAPEVFQLSEAGLWDGRPSLGGVWVAHPSAVDPERVRIVNRANGREVVGALFRRERDLPGPALQVSSDAAEALGMLPGAPAELEVTALRRQEPPSVPAPPQADPGPDSAAAEPVPAEPPADAGEAPAAAAAASASADPAAIAAVARATEAIIDGAAVAPAPEPGAIATTTLDATAAAQPAEGSQAFVQIGLFDVESNATDAARQLVGQGLPARVVSSGGAWRLLLGPAATEAEQATLLRAAVAAGFADAYLVSS